MSFGEVRHMRISQKNTFEASLGSLRGNSALQYPSGY
jgi:hypothetical protein